MKYKKGFTVIESIVSLCLFFILIFMVVASINAKPTHDSFLSSQSNSPAIPGTIIPDATNYVVDTTGQLTTEELAALDAKLKSLDDGTHQIAVLMVDTTAPLSIEEYGIRVAEKWKVGDKGLDNGAIIILAVNDRKVRIEVGYGLEGDLNDAKAGDIITNVMTPLLKQGKWADAISAGIDSINSDLNQK